MGARRAEALVACIEINFTAINHLSSGPSPFAVHQIAARPRGSMRRMLACSALTTHRTRSRSCPPPPSPRRNVLCAVTAATDSFVIHYRSYATNTHSRTRTRALVKNYNDLMLSIN